MCRIVLKEVAGPVERKYSPVRMLRLLRFCLALVGGITMSSMKNMVEKHITLLQALLLAAAAILVISSCGGGSGLRVGE
jgi:hypothetical protein